MRNNLTDTEILAFALHGCNAAEIAAYVGTSEEAAQACMNRVLRAYGHPGAIEPKYSNRGVNA